MDSPPQKRSASESDSVDSLKKSPGVSIKDKLRTKKQRYDALVKKSAPVKFIVEKDSFLKILLQSIVVGSKATLAYISTEKSINEIFDLMFCSELSLDCGRLAHGAWSILTIESTTMMDLILDFDKPHFERFLSFLDQDQTIRTGKTPTPQDPVPVWVIPNVFYYFSTTFRRWLLAKPEKVYGYLIANSKQVLTRITKHFYSVEMIYILVSILKTEKKVPKDHPAHQWCLDTVLPFLFNKFSSAPDKYINTMKELLLGLSINRDWQMEVFHVFAETLITKYFNLIFNAIANPTVTSDAMEVYHACFSYSTTTTGKGPTLLVPLTKQVIQNVDSLKTMLGSKNNTVVQYALSIVNQQLMRGGADIAQATLPVIIKTFFSCPNRTVYAYSVSSMITTLLKNERYQVFQTQLLQDLKLGKLIADSVFDGKMEKYPDWALYVYKIVASLPDSEKALNQLLVNLEKTFKARSESPADTIFNISSDLRKQQQIASQTKLAGVDGKEEKEEKDEKSKDKKDEKSKEDKSEKSKGDKKKKK